MENVNENYLEWLERTVGLQSSLYSLLLRKLYKTNYFWMNESDRDRATDGLQLRIFFAEEDSGNVPDGSVSVLEVLVALSVRIDDWLSGGEDARSWFMTMLHNLSLDGYSDSVFMEPGNDENVTAILEKWMSGEFSKSGSGGLFPLREPPCDQRKCSIEIQLQYYLKENRQLIGIDLS